VPVAASVQVVKGLAPRVPFVDAALPGRACPPRRSRNRHRWRPPAQRTAL